MNKKRFTTYDKAVKFLGNNLVLCNNIVDIDDDCLDFRFSLEDENGDQVDIFQYFLTDCSEDDVKFLEKSFNLLFAYSEKLDLFVLCVDHWGTSWDYVSIEVLDDDIPDSSL